MRRFWIISNSILATFNLGHDLTQHQSQLHPAPAETSADLREELPEPESQMSWSRDRPRHVECTAVGTKDTWTDRSSIITRKAGVLVFEFVSSLHISGWSGVRHRSDWNSLSLSLSFHFVLNHLCRKAQNTVEHNSRGPRSANTGDLRSTTLSQGNCPPPPQSWLHPTTSTKTKMLRGQVQIHHSLPNRSAPAAPQS